LFLDEDYYDKAYTTLHPLLQMKSNNIEIEYKLLDAGLYLILSHRYTADDINIIWDRYEKIITQLENDINNVIKTIVSA
jgi:hypothetical protein